MMSLHFRNMYFLTFGLQMISLWKISDTHAQYSLLCPVQAHWKHRADTLCKSSGSYFCVYNQNRRNFTEFCSKKAESEKKGFKLVIRGAIDGQPCERHLYQPFKFSSDGNSDCVLKKSLCTEEGQVIYKNGNSTIDSLCRCDNSRGYDFIHRPQHRCYCVQSKEDCSCYYRKCSPTEFLSQDYECLNLKTLERNSECSIDIFDGTKKTSTAIPTGINRNQERTIDRYSWPALMVILACIAIVSAFVIGLLSKTGQVQVEICVHSLSGYLQTAMNSCNKRETSCLVPHDVLELQENEIMEWRKSQVQFEETRASKTVLSTLKTHRFVIISGPPGSGKSALAYNTALMLEKDAGFNILTVKLPEEIQKYLLPESKQVFVIDDPVGKYTVDDSNIQRWKNEEGFIKQTFTKSSNTKLILTCRSYIYKCWLRRNIDFSPIHCDLLSNELKLSLSEREKMCTRYHVPELNDKTIIMSDFFPLICALYFKHVTQKETNSYFVNQVLEEEMKHIKDKSDIAFLALALLVVHNNNIAKQSLSLENETIKELLNDLCNECGLKYFPSTTVLLSALYDLIGTYVKETEHGFACIHDTMFRNLSFIVGSSIIHCVLKYGKSEFLACRLQLASIQQEHDELVIMVKPEQEELYFQRILLDIRKGNHSIVFTGIQMKHSRFRSKLRNCLKSLKDIDVTCDANNSSPLHVVSEQGYEDLVFALYQIKKDQMNHQDNSKRTPLFMACLGGHDKVIQTILGIDHSSLHIADREDLMPLDAASLNDYSSTVALLLKNGANINRKDKTLKRTTFQRACESGSIKVVSELLTLKPDIKNTDIHGLKAIHIACQRGHLNIVKILLEYKDMTNECDAHGRTPLWTACESNQQDIVRLLLENKANVNQIDVKQISPLYIACQIGNDNIVGVLLDNFAKVNITSDNGFSPLHVASMKGKLKCVEILLDKNAETDLATEQGWTAFFLSCSKGHLDICRLLHFSGANVNVCDKSANTPLHVACREKHERIVRFLIDHDANVNAVNASKESPLYIACGKVCFDVVQLLIDNHADVNIHNEKGNSPLHVACIKGNKTIVQLLLDQKANKQKRNKAGKTPFDIVQEKKNDTIVDMFNSHEEK